MDDRIGCVVQKGGKLSLIGSVEEEEPETGIAVLDLDSCQYGSPLFSTRRSRLKLCDSVDNETASTIARLKIGNQFSAFRLLRIRHMCPLRD